MAHQAVLHRSATEVATETIRKRILDGTLSAGERLNQDEIASTLGLSRLPVREALRKLESFGLVAIVPRRGAMGSSYDSGRDSGAWRWNLEQRLSEASSERRES